MNALKAYFLTLISIGLSGAVLSMLSPNAQLKRMTSIVCGLIMLLAAVRPIAQVDWQDIGESLARIKLYEQQAQKQVMPDNKELIADIIKETSETYILDKAEALGFYPLQVQVIMAEDSQQPYPREVKIIGCYSEMQRRRLSMLLEEDLAILPDRQQWTWTTTQ